MLSLTLGQGILTVNAKEDRHDQILRAGIDSALVWFTLDETAWTGQPAGTESPMKRTMFKSKLHRVIVTHADLEYEGSVTIDEVLMHAANILPYEQVRIWNVTNGSRLETYALPGKAGSGVICVNGAAARHAQPGDTVIIATFAEAADEAEARAWRPTVVRVDGHNRIVDCDGEDEIPGPAQRSVS
jgi:aspartate 1-decarboxylase